MLKTFKYVNGRIKLSIQLDLSKTSYLKRNFAQVITS